METYKVTSRDGEYTVTVVDKATGGGTVTVAGREFHVEFTGGEAGHARSPSPAMASSGVSAASIAPDADGSIVAPIPGKIVSVHVEVGDPVLVDQVVLTLEAMKMENEITSHVTGTVTEIAVSEGSETSFGQLLMKIG